MVLMHKKFLMPILWITLILVPIVTMLFIYKSNRQNIFMGAHLYRENKVNHELLQPVINSVEPKQDTERFQRPSKQSALKLNYSFTGNSAERNITFESSSDVVKAYYSILKDAENMDGYCGGCGTIGSAKLPFSFAYNLFSDMAKQQTSLDDYIASFRGTAHTTLLKLVPAYIPPNTPDNIKYFFVELEIITGPKCDEANIKKKQPSYFTYYYGLITTELTSINGWKIKSINYIPEDFLCAPYHFWYWDSTAVVQIVYNDWFKLVDKIERVEIEDSYIQIYSKGNGYKYKFDVIRLTNGEDILLHEYIWKNGKWEEVNLIEDIQRSFKFSILKF